MYKRELARSYRYTDADIIQIADNIANTAQRDLIALAEFGVTQEKIDDLRQSREAFYDTSTDVALTGDMIIATQAKDAKREEILNQTRRIADRARIHFGQTDARFRRFGVDLLTRNNDLELQHTATIVVMVATQYLADLEELGLTQSHIDTLQTAVQEFNTLLINKQLAISDRDLAVENRITLGNALHSKIKSLTAKGKLCWGDNNEARYNDYVLHTGSKKPNIIDGSVTANNQVNASVTAVRKNTPMEITNNGITPIQLYFAAEPTATQGSTTTTIEPGEILKIKAEFLGFHARNNIRHLILQNKTHTDGSYIIEWG